MGDSGEGLVDAEARFQEKQAEREAEKTRRDGKAAADPDRDRTLRSLGLAKVELQRQAESTQHPVRLEQIREALREIDRRIAEASASTK
jgi:hypothetical protein